MAFKIECSQFNDGGTIPSKYTCDGANVSPSLKWSGAPAGVKSFALICDDPDAPIGDWVHWALFNIPPETTGLEENFPSDKTFKNGMISGLNDFKKYGYGGPCPPSGAHRYFFKLYALDTALKLGPGASKKEILNAMAKHIIAETRLMGVYKRK